VFRELEGDFLVGALSAHLSANSKIGFLGGADIPVIRRIHDGWKQGALHVKPDVLMLSEYTGGKDDVGGFNRPDLGQKMAEKLYQAGADVLYVAAGGTNVGAIQAAKEGGKMIITTSSDQRWMAPDVIVTCRRKNVGVAVLKLIEDLKKGTLKAGVTVLDLKAGGVDLVSLEHERIPPEIQGKLMELRLRLLEGKINVKEYPAE
ncbi:MAG: BMP family ABC transporter substrate-binding protein, partial [Desulfobacterota bacterium]|nr:BMP family ABC transporter substrate-binding protein [Thermodesulfobacteriota bacterium]